MRKRSLLISILVMVGLFSNIHAGTYASIYDRHLSDVLISFETIHQAEITELIDRLSKNDLHIYSIEGINDRDKKGRTKISKAMIDHLMGLLPEGISIEQRNMSPIEVQQRRFDRSKTNRFQLNIMINYRITCW